EFVRCDLHELHLREIRKLPPRDPALEQQQNDRFQQSPECIKDACPQFLRCHICSLHAHIWNRVKLNHELWLNARGSLETPANSGQLSADFPGRPAVPASQPRLNVEVVLTARSREALDVRFYNSWRLLWSCLDVADGSVGSRHSATASVQHGAHLQG